MGLILFILFAALEIGLAVYTRRKEKEKKAWRKNRLLARGAELVIVGIAMLLPQGQRWRLAPALIFLAVLLLIAALKMLLGRKKEDGEKKTGAAAANCVLSILLIALLLVPAFVFTGYSGLPASGAYPVKEASAILIDGSRKDPFEQDGSSREVPVHFFYPEAGEDGGETFPLVIFSHGAFGYYQSNYSTYMELASNGYVVAALDHPHHAFFTEDTEGKTIVVDSDFISTAMNLNTMEDPQKLYELYTRWMSLRMGDMGFVLDELKAARENGPDADWYLKDSDAETIRSILHRTDISKIGLMGHSMGGATAVGLGRERDDVTAVIDIDGTMLSEYTGVADGKLTVREEPYRVPVLEFKNWETSEELAAYLAEYREEGGRYPNDELMRHAAAGFSTTIRGTKHMDFTDLPLLSPTLGNMLGSGERSTEETMKIVNSLVLDFFNCYLKGEGAFAVQDVY